jgi:uncharacterized OB-fold protein
MGSQLNESSQAGKKQIPVAEGLFYQPSSPDEKPYLIGSKCNVCGHLTFPKIPICPRCAKKNTMEEVHLSGKGEVESFTIVWSPLPGFKAPSVQSYIKLSEGITIWSLMTGCEPSEDALKIGMEVELVIGPVRQDAEGNEIISYQFKPVKKG